MKLSLTPSWFPGLRFDDNVGGRGQVILGARSLLGRGVLYRNGLRSGDGIGGLEWVAPGSGCRVGRGVLCQRGLPRTYLPGRALSYPMLTAASLAMRRRAIGASVHLVAHLSAVPAYRTLLGDVVRVAAGTAGRRALLQDMSALPAALAGLVRVGVGVSGLAGGVGRRLSVNGLSGEVVRDSIRVLFSRRGGKAQVSRK